MTTSLVPTASSGRGTLNTPSLGVAPTTKSGLLARNCQTPRRLRAHLGALECPGWTLHQKSTPPPGEWHRPLWEAVYSFDAGGRPALVFPVDWIALASASKSIVRALLGFPAPERVGGGRRGLATAAVLRGVGALRAAFSFASSALRVLTEAVSSLTLALYSSAWCLRTPSSLSFSSRARFDLSLPAPRAAACHGYAPQHARACARQSRRGSCVLS